MRKRLALSTLVVAAVLGAYGIAGAAPLGDELAALFGPRMIRAEVVVADAGGSTHDYRVDRGRISTVTQTSLTLQERDGTTVTLPLGAGVQVLFRGAPAPPYVVRRAVGRPATAIRDAAGGSTRILIGR